MATREPNGLRTDKTAQVEPVIQAPRTITEIEQRAALIRESERDAMTRLADLLRELAVELPHESKLPVRFAETAKALDMYVRVDMPWAGMRTVNDVVGEWTSEKLEDIVDACKRALRRRH